MPGGDIGAAQQRNFLRIAGQFVRCFEQEGQVSQCGVVDDAGDRLYAEMAFADAGVAVLA